jgi:hypothetical protein
MHVEAMHAPATQLSPDGHTLPHAPQLLGSLVRSTHLPLQTVPVHVEEVHSPATQLSPAGQTVPHAPQLLGSSAVSTSQPSAACPSQSARPGAQSTMWHCPAVQAAIELGVLQTSPHEPQLFGSLVRSTHWPLQTVPMHEEDVHAPSTQLSPAGHTSPHAPQFFGSLARSTHWPLQVVPLHGAVQAPATQLSPEGQTSPHAPQFFGSVSKSTHWPLHRMCAHLDGETQPLSRQTLPFEH